MEGKGVRWLAFCAGLGTGYTLGLATYRWLWHQGDHQLISSLANSLQALTAEVSHLRQALSEAGTQLREVRRTSVRSTRIASSDTKKEISGESEREDEDEEEGFYESASSGSHVETLELSNSPEECVSNGSEELKEFLEEVDSSLQEAMSNEEKCSKVLKQLRQKVEQCPDDIEVLWRAGSACLHQSSFHKKHSDTVNEVKMLEEGMGYTKKALEMNEDCWQAHKWHAILTGAAVVHKGVQERISGGYKFKEHIDRAIQLKPDDSNSYHLLGRWQFEVAGLSWLERKAAGALFATPPTSTYEEALESFNKAEELKPNSWKSNLLWLAKCHLKLQNEAAAVEWLQRAWDIQNVTPEDEEVTEELKKLLCQFLPDKFSQYS